MLMVAADLHLDAGASLGRLPDQESSWRRFCTAAADAGATVIWAGDSHHHRKPTPAAIAAWQSGLEILREGDCELYGIPGNHCITSEDLPSTLEVACAGYDCTIFRAPGLARTEDGIVGFLPWSPPRLNAREASEALMIVAADLAERGARILIAHHAIAGGSLPTGLPVLDLAEPMLDPHALSAMGYEIVIAGHIHKRQVILADGECMVAQCGPLARGNFGEATVETGAWAINRVGHEGVDSSFLDARPFDIPDRRFVAVDADVTEAGHYAIDQILDQILDADVADAIVRVTWSQRADQAIDTVAILAALSEYGAHRVDTLTPIIERPVSTRSQGVSEASDPREAWDAWQIAQAELASEQVMDAAREAAHERIGGAA